MFCNEDNGVHEFVQSWAEKSYDAVEKYYTFKIKDKSIRECFIRSLAYSYGEGDKVINEEMKRSGFDEVVYYLIMEDYDELYKLWKDDIQQDQISYMLENLNDQISLLK